MLYREAGDFKTSYVADSQTFPIKFDRIRYYIVVAIAFGVIPFVIDDYWANAVFVPFLIYAIAAIGLNILTGYCGQVSLGTGGFMAVGAYACYKLMTAMPDVSIIVHVLLAGLITAFVGVLFGLPSLRIKGFYLAVATLAAQFFLVWLFNKVPWFFNYSASGQITAPERSLFGIAVTGASTPAWAKYLFCLVMLFTLAWLARNLTRGSVGRRWMAIRDMDIAAEIIGVNPLTAKLSAFAVSSFYIGIAGALFFTVYLGAVEVGEAFGIQKSFLVLFMVIIGGLGSIFGS
ncbi:MAG TPA: branched-chain amino acid ABC transporter permease, partial [Rhizobium sp.]|nr:branched-chain amino acid ABC transporter permease [Rhizobium sp.]